MALGALQAIEAAGRKVNEDIYLVGVDALTEAVQNVIDKISALPDDITAKAKYTD